MNYFYVVFIVKILPMGRKIIKRDINIQFNLLKGEDSDFKEDS